MKILVISPTILPVPPPMYGGIEVCIYDLAEALNRLGHEVTLAAVVGSVPPPGVRLVETTRPGRLSYEYKALNAYSDLMRDYDVVCDETHLKLASSRRDNKAYVPVSQTLSLPTLPIDKPCLVCLSRSHAEYIRNHYGYVARYIHSGINLAQFIPLLDWKEKSNRFLFVGTFNPAKGALKATQFCKRINAPLDLIEGRMTDPESLRLLRFLTSIGLPVGPIVSKVYKGSFPLAYYASVLSASRAPNVNYHGPVKHTEVGEYMARAKALIFPLKHQEPFGLVVAESLASGTPVIAYRRGSMPELIEDGVTGFLVEPDDELGFIRAMREIESINPESCRRYAEQHLSRERMAAEYAATFEDVLNGHGW